MRLPANMKGIEENNGWENFYVLKLMNTVLYFMTVEQRLGHIVQGFFNSFFIVSDCFSFKLISLDISLAISLLASAKTCL
mgnify:CR=1 FL=1